MKTNAAGIALIKRFEALRLDAYLCPAGVPTIGYGHTKAVQLGQCITKAQAEALLELDVEHFETEVERLCPGANENQFAALVSFAFNLGWPALELSTLRKRFLAGDMQGCADEFPRWVRANGRVLSGLIKRRLAERALFLTPVAPPRVA